MFDYLLKKLPLVGRISISSIPYSAHNFIIEAHKIYERSKYSLTWEIPLGSLVTLLRYAPCSKIFPTTRYIVILQNCKTFSESGRGQMKTRDPHGINEIFQNWCRSPYSGSVLRLSWLEYNASGVEDSQKRGRGLYRLRFTGHPMEKTRGCKDGDLDGGRSGGTGWTATCNLTADCASFTSSSDIVQSQYHGNGQEQKSVPILFVPSSFRRHEGPMQAKCSKKGGKKERKKEREKNESKKLREIDNRGSESYHRVVFIAERTLSVIWLDTTVSRSLKRAKNLISILEPRVR